MLLLKKSRRQRICRHKATLWDRRLKLEKLDLLRVLRGNPSFDLAG